MRLREISVAVGTLAICLTADIGRAQPPDPIVGTWHLNAQKSKFSPGPPLKSAVLTFEQTAQGMKTIAELTLPDGQPRNTEFTAPTDGTDVPLTGSPIAEILMKY